MTLLWIRIFFVLVCSLVGFQLGGAYSTISGEDVALTGFWIGVIGALVPANIVLRKRTVREFF